jgi:hypothetical protein
MVSMLPFPSRVPSRGRCTATSRCQAKEGLQQGHTACSGHHPTKCHISSLSNRCLRCLSRRTRGSGRDTSSSTSCQQTTCSSHKSKVMRHSQQLHTVLLQTR